MIGHPANKVRLPEGQSVLGTALHAAINEGADALHAIQGVEFLGMRVKRATLKSGERRSYYLETWRADGTRFYRLRGGIGSAVTVLDASGEPTLQAQRSGRGFSPEFRAWIADAVADDVALYAR